jgi:hypothetical protein
MDAATLTDALIERSSRLGIDACGVCAAEPYERTEALIDDRRAAGLFADMRFTMAQPLVWLIVV